MVYSSTEILGVVSEIINRRAPMVLGKAGKAMGLTMPQYIEVVLPKPVQHALKAVGVMHLRYIKGQYQHEEKEVLQLETLANHLIEISQTAGGHPVRPVHFDPRQMEAKKPCSKGTYVRVMEKIAAEL